MRKIVSILLAAAMLVSLSACAKTEKSEQKTLVLYTSMKDTLITALIADFESKNPNIKVETQIDGAGSLMTRIEAERADGKILADLIWTSEIPDFYYMKNEGLLLQYSPAGADKVFNPLENADNYFLPARLGTMGIAYNTDIIKTPPESWQDLLGADFRDGFAIADPTTSGTAMMSVVLLNEVFGEDFFRDLKANGAVVGQGSSQVAEAVANGELAACLAVDYITLDKIKSGAPVAMAYPNEMLVIPSPIAIFKDGSNTESAKKFADYLISAEAQQIIANIGTLPVLEGIEASGEFNIPTVAEAMERAVSVDDSNMEMWKDEIITAFLGIMGGGELPLSANTIPYPDGVEIEGAASVERMFDVPNSPYFPALDFYNMKSGGSLTILENFKTLQQTTEVTCGPACVTMVLEHYGLFDGFNYRDLYELRADTSLPQTMLKDLITMFENVGEFDIYSTYDLENPEEVPMDMIQNALKENKPVIIGDGEWGIGHWRIVIGYDDMGDDIPYNDVLILAESYDTSDHNQDGYMIMPFERLYFNWTNQYDPDFPRNLFLIASPKS